MLWSNSTTVSFGPKSLANFVATDDLAVGFDQDAQDLQGLVGENQDGALILAQLARTQVDFKDSEAHPLGQGSFHGSVSGAIGKSR